MKLPGWIYLEATLSLMSPRYELYFLMDKDQLPFAARRRFMIRRSTYAGTDRQSDGVVAPLQLNLSTKEDLQRKCGALFVFTGGRSGEQLAPVSVLLSIWFWSKSFVLRYVA